MKKTKSIANISHLFFSSNKIYYSFQDNTRSAAFSSNIFLGAVSANLAECLSCFFFFH